jgi:hypothetical protein
MAVATYQPAWRQRRKMAASAWRQQLPLAAGDSLK